MVEFRVLGALEVVRGDVSLPVPSRRQRALLTRLLLARGRVVPVDALIDALWDDEPPQQARHALQEHVSRLRVGLGPVLVTQAPGYMVAVDPEAVDAERFEAGVRRSGELLAYADPAAAVERLDEILALWRGPAYAEFAVTFARAAAVRLEELKLTALGSHVEALLALGSVDRALGEVSELASEHPLREGPHCLLMRALYLSGRQTEALEVYHRIRDRLRTELGMDPSPVLERTHEQVLRQSIVDPAVHGPAPPVQRARSSGPTRVSLTSFVGRNDELRRLRALLGSSRVVTLVGPGGVGKTRLAQESTAQRDGTVRWVDLVPARDPADVPRRFLDALGLVEPAEGAAEDALEYALRPAEALIVVDNCEHVIGPVAAIVERIVASCPGVVVLATSRERLAIAGERVLNLPPLPDPTSGTEPTLRRSPAVALFAERLRAAGGPELSETDVLGVAEICRWVGGLPLAIELAAARSRSLGTATVAQRPSLDLLAGGRRTDQSRHRSLRAVVDWSYDLLASSERVLFRRLAVFAGLFTLGDAENVCPDGALERDRVAELLAALVDKSMVVGPERDRYRLLDPMRTYAAEELAAHGEDRRLAAAHARHFVRLAELVGRGMLTPREPEWANEVVERIDELRAVHRWTCAHDSDLAVRLAVALAHYATYHMRFELHDWAKAAASLPDAAQHPLRPAALGSAAAGAWARGEFDEAERLARQGLAVATEGDPLTARAMLVLGDIATLTGRFRDAVHAYDHAVELGGTAQPHLTCEAHGSAAIVLSYLGDDTAAARLDAGQRLAEELGSPGLLAFTRYFAGETWLARDPAIALDHLEASRRIAAGAGALFVEGLAAVSSASLRARAGTDPAAALAAFRDAIEHWRRVGNRTQQWVTLRNLVPILVRGGHHELACVLHRALASAPVQLPVGIPVPEIDALAAAVAEARQRLGDHAVRLAEERGTRVSLDELIDAVLATIDTAVARAPDHAGSSR